ncbi:hypothetical protein QFC19_000993 [Naganishia cerealis]|uniref:Uncharacterized protein n=1 Tax=Naganishia cerealis TaxID=610337 RepID=A0ACC2WJ18_9TREE|nr:hypothetical protein QFC19_000993 [Naganishia cerealis]
MNDPPSAAIESLPQYASFKTFSGNAFDKTGEAGVANLFRQDEGYDQDHLVEIDAIENAKTTHRKDFNDLSPQSGVPEEVFACNAHMTAAAGGGHSCRSGAPHSQTCLFSSSGPFRPLPSPESVEVSAVIDQEAPTKIVAGLPFRSSLQSLYLPNSTQLSSRPLPQLRTPSYGVRTSHVRHLPRVSALDTQYASQIGGTAIRMTNKALPPIQTILDRIPSPNYRLNAVDRGDYNWNDQPCFKYLSYPSPSSSTDAVVYETSPVDSFALFAGQRCHEFAGMDSGRERRDGQSQVFTQTEHTTIIEPQYKNGKPIDATRKHSTLYDDHRQAARFWEQKSTSSSFTSSDIERASSIESYFEQGQDEGGPEMTIFLGERCAASPGSTSLVSTDARMVYSATTATCARLSAPTTIESGLKSGYLSPSDSVFQRSPSAKAMRDLLPSATSAFMRPATSAAPTSSYGSDGSGSDYEASIIKNKKANVTPIRPKIDKAVGKSAAVSKILRQDRLHNEKPTERIDRFTATSVRWHSIDDTT